MAAIEGLTVIINGDATGFSRTMREMKAEANGLRRHMQTVTKALKFDPTSTQLITRQQQLFRASLAQTAGQLDVLRAKEAAYSARSSELTAAERRQWKRVQREISATELRYSELTAEAVKFGAAASAGSIAAAAGLKRFSDRMRMAGTYAVALSAGMSFLARQTLQASVDFESSFAGVRKTIIATEDEYAQLARASRDLALENPVDVNDINRIMELGGQLNISREHLVKFADTMARLDVSTDMGIEDGSLKLAQFMNIANMSQADVDRLGATIVDLGNNSATTEDRIMNMAMRIVGSGRNIGMSATDVLGLATSLSSVGIQAEMGGNAISTIMNRIDKDVANNTDKLQVWADTAGMTAEDFAREWENDVTPTFIKVIKGMGDYRDEGGNLNLLLKDMGISYMRQIDTMQRLSRAGDLTEQTIARASVAFEQNTALVRESEQRYSTAESKMQLMKNAVNELAIEIGNNVLPYFSDLVVGVKDAVTAFSHMSDATKATIINTAALAVAGGPVMKGITTATGVIGSLIGGMNSLKTRMAAAAAGTAAYTEMTIAADVANSAEAVSAKLAGDAAGKAAPRHAALAGAAGAEAAALRASGSAAATSAAKHGLLSTAMEWGRASSLGLATALGVSNAAALGIAGGALLAVGAIAALTVEARNAIDPTKNLTKESQEAANALAAHEAQYKAVALVQGENSEAALKLKAALNEEREAVASSSETYGQAHERIRASIEDRSAWIASLEQATDDAQKSAGNALNLADRLDSLVSGGTSRENLAEIAGVLFQLNSAVPDLGLSFDAATGRITSSVADWHQAVKDFGNEELFENASGSITGVNEQLEATQKDLDDAQRKLDEIKRQRDERMAGIGTTGAGARDYQSQWAVLANGVYADDISNYESDIESLGSQVVMLTAKQRYYNAVIQSTATHELALQDAQAKVASGQLKLADVEGYTAEMYGIAITKQEVAEAETERFTALVKEETADLTELVETISEAAEKTPAFARAMAAAGVDAEQLAAQLDGTGVSVDELAKGIDDFYNKAMDGTSAIEAAMVDDETEFGLDKWRENLEENHRITEEWSSNLKTLYDRAGEDGRAFVMQFAEMGPEYARAVADLTNLTDEELADLIAQWQGYGRDADRFAVDAYGIQKDAAKGFEGSIYDIISAVEGMEDVSRELFDAIYEHAEGSIDGTIAELDALNQKGIDPKNLIVTDNGMIVNYKGQVLDLDTMKFTEKVFEVDDNGTITDVQSRLGVSMEVFDALYAKADGDINATLGLIQQINDSEIEPMDLIVSDHGSIIDMEGRVLDLESMEFTTKVLEVDDNGTVLGLAEELNMSQEVFDKLYESGGNNINGCLELIDALNAAGIDTKYLHVTDNGEIVDKNGEVVDLQAVLDALVAETYEVEVTDNGSTSGVQSDIDSLESSLATLTSSQWVIDVAVNTPSTMSLEAAVNSGKPLYNLGRNFRGGIFPAHADGGIFDRPTLTSAGWVGEAGTEALIPLSNRAYVRPFAKAVADEMGGGGSVTNNNYRFTIDVSSERQFTDRFMALMDELATLERM